MTDSLRPPASCSLAGGATGEVVNAMAAAVTDRRQPLGLVITGEVEFWQSALEQIVGSSLLTTYRARDDRELLEVVGSGLVDAAVLDDIEGMIDVLQMLRMIRRLNAMLPVVIVTRRSDRRVLETALRLAAFSVVSKPLELEPLLRQIQRIMERLDLMLRMRPRG